MGLVTDPVQIDFPASGGPFQELKIVGTRFMPNKVDMEAVNYVYDVSGQSFIDNRIAVQARASNGVAVRYVIPVAPTGYTLDSANALISTVDENARLIGMVGEAQFNAAGVTALNGKIIRIGFELRSMATGQSCLVDFTDFTLATGGPLVYTAYPKSSIWNGAVPYNFGLTVYATVLDGTVFPAASVFEVRGVVTLKKRGSKLAL
jgi:hypothetical protein